jgi:hypothetical protein
MPRHIPATSNIPSQIAENIQELCLNAVRPWHFKPRKSKFGLE